MAPERYRWPMRVWWPTAATNQAAPLAVHESISGAAGWLGHQGRARIRPAQAAHVTIQNTLVCQLGLGAPAAGLQGLAQINARRAIIPQRPFPAGVGLRQRYSFNGLSPIP